MSIRSKKKKKLQNSEFEILKKKQKHGKKDF